jgi:hypothetical protein
MLDLERTLFGIEFETCVCAYSGPLLSIVRSRYNSDSSKIYASQLATIAQSKGIDVNIRYQKDPRENIDYTSWTVTEDASISCALTKTASNRMPSDRFHRGGSSTPERCPNFSASAEIVTPTYRYDGEDYLNFQRVLTEVLFYPDFSYTSNISQGMHVNVSHPEQNFLKALEMWWYFEDVITKFTPVGLRGSYYVRSLRNIFPTIEDLRSDYITFYEYPDNPPAKYTALCKKSNRLEFRLVPTGMSTEHVLSWLGFCVRFVAASAHFVKPIDSDAGKFDELFELIDNLNIKEYFKRVVAEHNDEEYEATVPIAREIKKGMSLSMISDDAFIKVCKYNLVVPNTLFYKILDEGNIKLLKILVDETIDEQDLMLDFKNIIDNWPRISSYSDMLLEVAKDTKNYVYTFIIKSLVRGSILADEHFWAPPYYSPSVTYLENYLASRT